MLRRVSGLGFGELICSKKSWISQIDVSNGQAGVWMKDRLNVAPATFEGFNNVASISYRESAIR